MCVKSQLAILAIHDDGSGMADSLRRYECNFRYKKPYQRACTYSDDGQLSGCESLNPRRK